MFGIIYFVYANILALYVISLDKSFSVICLVGFFGLALEVLNMIYNDQD